MINRKILAISALAILAVSVFSTGAIHEAKASGGGGSTTVTYKADLTIGYANYGVMKGTSNYKADSTGQRITAQVSNAPGNTVLTFKVNGVFVGNFTTDASGSGKYDSATAMTYYEQQTGIPHVQLGDLAEFYIGNNSVRSGQYHT